MGSTSVPSCWLSPEHSFSRGLPSVSFRLQPIQQRQATVQTRTELGGWVPSSTCGSFARGQARPEGGLRTGRASLSLVPEVDPELRLHLYSWRRLGGQGGSHLHAAERPSTVHLHTCADATATTAAACGTALLLHERRGRWRRHRPAISAARTSSFNTLLRPVSSRGKANRRMARVSGRNKLQLQIAISCSFTSTGHWGESGYPNRGSTTQDTASSAGCLLSSTQPAAFLRPLPTAGLPTKGLAQLWPSQRQSKEPPVLDR